MKENFHITVDKTVLIHKTASTNMSEIIVTKGIHPPKRGGRQKSELAERIDALEIGEALEPVNKAQSVYYSNRAKSLGKRLSCENLSENTYRLHRTA